MDSKVQILEKVYRLAFKYEAERGSCPQCVLATLHEILNMVQVQYAISEVLEKKEVTPFSLLFRLRLFIEKNEITSLKMFRFCLNDEFKGEFNKQLLEMLIAKD